MRRVLLRKRKTAEGDSEYPGAAFACYHVTLLLEPVRWVRRDPPAFEGDTGWVFACGQDEHLTEDWMMVAPRTVLSKHPSVEPVFGALIPGDTAWREDVNQPWHLEFTPPGEADNDQ
jgi:hypothetical protein